MHLTQVVKEEGVPAILVRGQPLPLFMISSPVLSRGLRATCIAGSGPWASRLSPRVTVTPAARAGRGTRQRGLQREHQGDGRADHVQPGASPPPFPLPVHLCTNEHPRCFFIRASTSTSTSTSTSANGHEEQRHGPAPGQARRPAPQSPWPRPAQPRAPLRLGT